MNTYVCMIMQMYIFVCSYVDAYVLCKKCIQVCIMHSAFMCVSFLCVCYICSICMMYIFVCTHVYMCAYVCV